MRASFSDTSDVTQAKKSVVEPVVNAVAEVEGVDPVELSDPVFAFIDPDALDTLVASTSAGTDLSVTFEAWDHEIEVSGDGTVRVDGAISDRVGLEGPAGTGRRRQR